MFWIVHTLPTPLWLPRLVAVIVNSGRPVATGYRWMTPADDRLSSCCLAAANDSIAALPRGALPLTIVWGGSVAMKRATLEAIRLRDFWRGAISDDAQMAEALRQAGLLAHAPRQGLLLTPVQCSWRGFLAFGVWAHRMFATGLGAIADAVFASSTMLIAVPTGVKIFNWIGTMFKGSVSFKTPMLYSVGFISMFIIGGLSGIMHASPRRT